MIRLSLKRYSFILTIQLIFLLIDLALNCIAVFFKGRKTVTFLYFLQDSFLLLSISSIIFMCFSTQVGFNKVMNKNFRVVAITIFYILLSISHHFLSVYFEVGEETTWQTALAILQKFSNAIYFNLFLNSNNLFIYFSVPHQLLFLQAHQLNTC